MPRADDARPLPASAAAFAALTRLPGTTTALVSGRALASLRAVATPPAGTLLVGSHGAEVWLGPDSAGLELTAVQAQQLERARACVADVTGRHPGTTAEHKPAGVVLHYRQASAEHGESAVRELLEALAGEPAVFITEGKMVLEISVVNANKGESLAMLRDTTGATAVVFVGDDVTDEHAFKALRNGDVGIKVGDGATSAAFRIPSPDALPAVLELLLAARTGAKTPE
ncbi:trehalose-phosphatase [Arthrobacter sp. ERGS1:01]|uniref:trehalose-phosphatase n=1 Tax=Arthrobacter sp. ERGS1:01 TaxID=1704044 RepID=UPI000A7E9EC1